MTIENYIEKTKVSTDIQEHLKHLNNSIQEARKNGLVVEIHNNDIVLGRIGSPIDIEVFEKIKYYKST